MPSRHKFMSTLDAHFKEVKTELKMLLSKQSHICVTADVWSSRAQSYLGVTVHFINESFDRESYLLGFKQLKQRQTYDVLAKALDEIFKDFGIEKSQITNIITDGGSAFCKMFKKYGDSIDVICLNTNGEEIELADSENVEAVDDGANVAETELDIVQQFMQDENGEEFVNEILNFDNITHNAHNAHNDDDFDNYFDNDFQGNTDPNEIQLPAQRRCVSHLLNLLAKDFEKHLSGNAKAAFNKTFNALHSLWVIVRVSSRAKTICKEILNATLKYPCETRWNSKLDCVRQCNQVVIQNKLNDLIDKLKSSLNSNTAEQLRKFTANDFSVMRQYEQVFGHVANSLDILQGEKNNSQGCIMPVLISMKTRISQLRETNNIIKDFKELILNLIDNRFKNYFKYNELNKDLILSAASLPRYKTTFIESAVDREYVKNLLVLECEKLCKERMEQRVNSQNVESSATDDSDFIVCFADNFNHSASIDFQIKSEVSQFLIDVRKENSILRDYRFIYPVFYKYNTTLSSSAPVERVFSQSLIIFTPRRNRITADNFEKTIFLKHNRMLFSEFHRKK